MKHLSKKHPVNGLQKVALAIGLSALLFVPASASADTGTSPNPPAAVAQNITVKGHIIDENGEPMIGVTVKVAGNDAL